jgi:hypothetical protein
VKDRVQAEGQGFKVEDQGFKVEDQDPPVGDAQEAVPDTMLVGKFVIFALIKLSI